MCAELGLRLEFRQPDDQDDMFRWIATDSDQFDALIINPVGYLKSGTIDFERYESTIKMIAHLKKPLTEVHLTNIFRPGEEQTKPQQGPEGEMAFICGLGIEIEFRQSNFEGPLVEWIQDAIGTNDYSNIVEMLSELLGSTGSA